MTPAIEVDRVSKRFAPPLPLVRKLLRKPGPGVVEALTDVSLQVAAGEIFGLVGRNGQGKTTLIKTTCGLIEPSGGRVRVFGHDSVRALREVKRRIGLVSADERSFYFRLSGRANLTFFGRLQGLPERAIVTRIGELAEAFELGALLDRPFQDYSTGNKQRLAIARALLPDPPLLLLDEPTRSLDPISAEGLRRVLAGWAGAGAHAGRAKTVLITTHNLAEIEALCARVAILSRGRVIECAPLPALRAKYARGEVVQVRVRGEVSAALEQALADELGTLGVQREPGGRTTLRLERQAEDDRLDLLITRLHGAGLGVVACDTEHFGLMQVLAQIEAKAGAP